MTSYTCVCFDCKVTYRRSPTHSAWRKCPHCGKQMLVAPRTLKTPRKCDSHRRWAIYERKVRRAQAVRLSRLGLSWRQIRSWELGKVLLKHLGG